jgi:hypothetical protein
MDHMLDYSIGGKIRGNVLQWVSACVGAIGMAAPAAVTMALLAIGDVQPACGHASMTVRLWAMEETTIATMALPVAGMVAGGLASWMRCRAGWLWWTGMLLNASSFSAGAISWWIGR